MHVYVYLHSDHAVFRLFHGRLVSRCTVVGALVGLPMHGRWMNIHHLACGCQAMAGSRSHPHISLRQHHQGLPTKLGATGSALPAN